MANRLAKKGLAVHLLREKIRFQGFKVSRFQGFKVSRFQSFVLETLKHETLKLQFRL
jgi:hypothetical protein